MGSILLLYGLRKNSELVSDRTKFTPFGDASSNSWGCSGRIDTSLVECNQLSREPPYPEQLPYAAGGLSLMKRALTFLSIATML
jgi:hypothetical protein